MTIYLRLYHQNCQREGKLHRNSHWIKYRFVKKKRLRGKRKNQALSKSGKKILKNFSVSERKSHPHQAKFLRIPQGGKEEKYQLIMKVSFLRTIQLMDSQIIVILQWKNRLKQQILQKMALTQIMKIIIQMKLWWLKSHLQITLKEERRKEKTEGRPTVSAMRQIHQSQRMRMEMRIEISWIKMMLWRIVLTKRLLRDPK